jgi:multiple sugar transport system substrate-binding protein
VNGVTWHRRSSRRALLRAGVGMAAAAALTAFGASATTVPSAAEATPTAGTQPTAASGEAVTIRIMMFMSDAQLAKADSDLFGPFQEEHPNLKIDHILRPGSGTESMQKLRAMIAGGDPPDVYDEFRAANGEAGEALDLVPFIDRDEVDIASVPKGILDSQKWQDGVYGMPMYAGGQFCLVINRDLFDAAGIAYPTSTWNDPDWTWTAFADIAVKLTKQADGRYEQFGVSDLGDWILFPFQMWGSFICAPVTREVVCDSQETIDCYQAIVDLAKVQHALPDISTQQGSAVWGDADPMLSGKAGISSYGLWSHTLYRQALEEGVNWAYLPYPKGRPEATVHTECNGGKTHGIVKIAKHPEEAWTLIKWEYDQGRLAKFLGRMPANVEGQKTWAADFYGSHYDKIRPEVLWEGWTSDPAEEPFYTHPKNEEATTKVLQPGWEQVWADQITVKQWLTEAKPEVEKILSSAS